MDRSAIFIDAGYLFAAAGKLVCGTRSRAALRCDTGALTKSLAAWVHVHSGGLDSLRTYWYDGAVNAVPTREHEEIGSLAYVKVRLGRVIQRQQKGVDALIYRDLMTLARERAIARAYLLSGDEDLREGVVAAQDMGVQVVLLGIPVSHGSNQSAALVRESDEHLVIPKDRWEPFFSLRELPVSPSVEPTASNARAAGVTFAESWIDSATRSELDVVWSAHPRIPRELDVQLVVDAEKTLGSLLERQELKHEVRAGVWSSIEGAAKRSADVLAADSA